MLARMRTTSEIVVVDGDVEAHGDGTLPLDHIALETEGLADAVARIEKAGIDYRLVDVPGRDMKQIFIRDPDGVAFELNFTNPEDLAAAARL